MTTHSKRQYTVIYVWKKTVDVESEIPLEDLMKDDKTECTYAIQDIMDRVLDLKESESIYFQPDRDNKASKGIIIRTQ